MNSEIYYKLLWNRCKHWLSFFKIFQEQKGEESINVELNRLRTLVTGTDRETDQQITDALEKIVSGIDDLLYQRQT